MSKPRVRLPLQIGTSATWAVARASATLWPGLAGIAAAIALAIATGGDGAEAIVGIGVFAAALLWFALVNVNLAIETRASDLVVTDEGVEVNGGSRHGLSARWDELEAPFAEVDRQEEKRLVLRKLPWAIAEEPYESVVVHRLFVVREGERELWAEADRPIEGESMEAAAATIKAVAEGRLHVAEAPSIETEYAKCRACGAPLVPDDADIVTCAFCREQVELPKRVRMQAKAAIALERDGVRTARIVARLIAQPSATRSNGWLALFAFVMFAAWPLGWGLIVANVIRDRLRIQDAPYVALPLVGLLAAFFFARGRLADRGALRLLTLGYGALAPPRPGEPSRCRVCVAPLPDEIRGGVVRCRYCSVENIAGIDLRPAIDGARKQRKSLDDALRARRRERRTWTLASVAAAVAFVMWAKAMHSYVDRRHELYGTPAWGATDE